MGFSFGAERNAVVAGQCAAALCSSALEAFGARLDQLCRLAAIAFGAAQRKRHVDLEGYG